MTMEIVSPAGLVGGEVLRQIDRNTSKEDLLALDCTLVYNEEVAESLNQQLSYEYPFQADMELYAMLSVSEIKRRRQALEAADQGEERDMPAVKIPGKPVGGAVRGTSFHRVLELLHLETVSMGKTKAEICVNIRADMEDMVEKDLILKEDAELVDIPKVAGLLLSPLGKRMTEAEKNGRLHREQQFMVGIPAQEMEIAQSDELVLVQGMIDAWIEEADGLVLIDYKTDQVGEGREQTLVFRYRTQLEYYKRSLEQITGRKVKEMMIYSFALEKEISMQQIENKQ